MSEAELIHKKILSEIPDTYQKTVGFPLYDITRAVAIGLGDLSQALTTAELGLNVDNLSGDELTLFIKQRKGVYRKEAEKATVRLTLIGNGTVHAGDLFESAGGVRFEAISEYKIVASGDVLAVAVTPGIFANVAANSITQMPITIPGIVAVTNTHSADGGLDAESDADLKSRYYLALRRPPTSGNVYHYMSWAKEVSGVGDCRVFPLVRGNNTVDVVIIDAQKKPALPALVLKTQEYIDPLSAGDGSGQAPIGAHCYVESARGVNIDVEANISLMPGYELSEVQKNIKNGIGEYLSKIAFIQNYVSAGKIAAAINDSVGVKDYSAFTLNGASENIGIGEREVAVLGTVVLGEV